MAPEVLTGNQYNESADIYSLGIVSLFFVLIFESFFYEKKTHYKKHFQGHMGDFY